MREDPNVLSDQPPRLSEGLRRLKIAFSELVNEYNYDSLTTALQHKILGYCIIFYAEKKTQSVLDQGSMSAILLPFCPTV